MSSIFRVDSSTKRLRFMGRSEERPFVDPVPEQQAITLWQAAFVLTAGGVKLDDSWWLERLVPERHGRRTSGIGGPRKRFGEWWRWGEDETMSAEAKKHDYEVNVDSQILRAEFGGPILCGSIGMTLDIPPRKVRVLFTPGWACLSIGEIVQETDPGLG